MSSYLPLANVLKSANFQVAARLIYKTILNCHYMLEQPTMESIDFDTQFPPVCTWVRLQLTGQTLYFSVVFIICIATVHKSSSLWPGQGNSDMV